MSAQGTPTSVPQMSGGRAPLFCDTALGHLPVEAENPYWTDNGAITIEDSDHWPVVLMPQSPV